MFSILYIGFDYRRVESRRKGIAESPSRIAMIVFDCVEIWMLGGTHV